MFTKFAKSKIIQVATQLGDFPFRDKTLIRVAAFKPIMLHPQNYLYVRNRAVSALERHGPNDNGDAFEGEELATRHTTFIGDPVNVDHDNDDIRKAIGIILDAVWWPEEMFVETILAINKKKAESKHPGLVDGILAGRITDTSMGCFVEESICSVCLAQVDGDVSKLSTGRGIAHTPDDYCQHVGRKGQEIRGTKVYEINRGVTFFEDSVITTEGADPNAKIADAFTDHPEEKTGEFEQYLVLRTSGSSTHAPQLDKGETMANPAVALKDRKVAATEGSQVLTMQEKPDYGGAPEMDKALATQAKGTSDSTKNQGSQLQSMDERGDYVLAISKLRSIAKSSPQNAEAIRSLVFGEMGVSAPPMEAPQPVGGVPAVVSEEEKKKDEEMGERAQDMKDEKAAIGSYGIAHKAMDMMKGVMDRLLPATASTKKAAGDEASGGGNPQTAIDAPDYGTGADKDKATHDQSKKTAPRDSAMRGSPLQTGQDAMDQSLAQKRRAKQVVSDADQAFSFITDQLAQGVGYDVAEKRAQDRFGKKAVVDARIKSRADQISDLNRGSMGSPGTENKKVGEGDEKAFEEERDDSAKSPDVEIKDRATASKGRRTQADGTRPYSEDRPMQSPTEPSTTPEPSVHGIPQPPAPSDAVSEITEEIRDDVAVGSKRVALEDEKPADEEKEPKEKKEAADTEEDKPKPALEDKPEATGTTDPRTLKGPATAAPKPEPEKEEVAGPERAKQVVKKMDEAGEQIDSRISSLKEEASILARAEMKTLATRVVRRIAVWQGLVDQLDTIASDIEQDVNEIAQVSKTSKKAASALGAGLASKILKAKAHLSVIAEENEKEETEKMEKEESLKEARKSQRLLVENMKLRREHDIQVRRTASVVRTRKISDLAKFAVESGLIKEEQIDTKVTEWSKMNDDQFAAVAQTLKGLRPRVAAPYISKNIRDAQRGSAVPGVDVMDRPIRAQASATAQDELEKGTLFM